VQHKHRDRLSAPVLLVAVIVLLIAVLPSIRSAGEQVNGVAVGQGSRIDRPPDL
jgi:hypothetical protein